MKVLKLALVGLALVASLGSCAASPTDPAEPKAAGDKSFDTGPEGPGLTAHLGDELIVLYAKPEGNVTVVDYIIQNSKTLQVVYHVESTAAPDFRLELNRPRFRGGQFKLKVFADKALTPFAEKDLDVPY